MVRSFHEVQGDVGANLRRLRKERTVSQEQLAVSSEVDRTYVSQIERGIGNPSLLVLQKVAAALDVDVEELLRSSLSAVNAYGAPGSDPRP